MIRILKYSLLPALLLMLVGCSKPPYTDTYGRDVSLSNDRGQWLILNVWAQWCAPCRTEIPELNALAAEGRIRVIGLDFDGNQEEALRARVSAMKIEFPVIEQSPLAALGVSMPKILPASYIISPKGRVVDTLYGPQTREALERRLHQLQEQNNNESSMQASTH